MPVPIALYFSGATIAGSFDDDFIVAVPSSIDNIINASDGDDLVLADAPNIYLMSDSSNISIASARDIDAGDLWSTEENPLIGDATVPHISIYDVATVGQREFYKVTATAGATLTVDIDFGQNGVIGQGVDTVVEIRDGAGNLLASNDNALTALGGLGSYVLAGGTDTSGDPYVTFVAPIAGTYYIVVRPASGGNFSTAASYVMHVSITGHGANAEAPVGNDTVNGGFGNDYLLGMGGSDTINGQDGDDYIYGGTGDDILSGGLGIDTLIGGSGVDQMSGGAGNDIYEVTESGDTVTEAANQGDDTVYSYVSFALTANIESLRLVGGVALTATGNALNNTLVGNALSNTLTGGAGNDTMYGGAGDDSYEVTEAGDTVVESAGEGNDTVYSYVTYAIGANVETLRLVGSAVNGTGNGLNNTLVGNGLANLLIGGAGNDTMYGGAGDDTYEITDAGDVVVENASEGNDTIFSYVSYALGDNVENLRLVGGAITATGNALNNMVVGNAMNNVLIGGAGNDIMVGSAGDDAYEVTEGGDIVYEAAGEGNDTVYSYADTYQMSLNVETMNLVGGARVGLGSAGNDTINGNAQNNVLNGNAGNDVLTGGGGVDQFWHLGTGAGLDTITDFSASTGETIVLSQTQFANFAAVQAKMFQSGANVVIAFSGSQTLTINNVTIGQLSAANFSFYSGPGAAPSETPGKHDGPQVMPHDEAVGGPAAEHDAFVLPVASEKTWTPLTLPDTHDLGGSGDVFSGAGPGGLHELASLAAFDHMPFVIDESLTQTHYYDF